MSYGDGTRPRRRGDGKWIASVEAGWTERGTRRRRSVVARTEAECKRRLRALRREMLAGRATTPSAALTVKRWADTWLPLQARRLRPNAYDADESAVRLWIVPTIGNRRLAELGAADVRAVDRAVLTAGRSGSTAVQVRRVLSVMLRDARRDGVPVPAPALLAEMPRRTANRRAAVPVPDAVRLLRAATDTSAWPPLSEDATPQERKMRRLAQTMPASRWLAALLQGMRSGECLGLTWDRIDRQAQTVTVERQLQTVSRRVREAGLPDWYDAEHLVGTYYLVPTKSAAGRRVIPLVPWMASALDQWREQCPPSPWGLVWPRPSGGPWSDGDDRLAGPPGRRRRPQGRARHPRRPVGVLRGPRGPSLHGDHAHGPARARTRTGRDHGTQRDHHDHGLPARRPGPGPGGPGGRGRAARHRRLRSGTTPADTPHVSRITPADTPHVSRITPARACTRFTLTVLLIYTRAIGRAAEPDRPTTRRQKWTSPSPSSPA